MSTQPVLARSTSLIATCSMFPLPLFPFERYMLADDRPHEPMAFQIRLQFTGIVDPDRLRSALAESVARHPLLRARITGSSRRDLRWIADNGELHFDCHPWGVPLEHPSVARIDLRCEPGLRTWVRYDADRSEIRWQFHHSCSDGIGAYRFIDEVLCRYHNSFHPEAPVALRAVRPELLPQRTRMGRTWLRRLCRLPLTVLACVASPLESRFAPPQALSLPHFQRPSNEELQRVVDMPAARLTRDEVSRLARTAKSVGVSLNDLLMRDTFVALQYWNERQQGAPVRGRLGLAVPFNLRSAEDDEQTVTNIVGMAPIHVGVSLLNNPARLLRFVSNVMSYYKRFGLALEFANVIAVIERIFGSLSPFLSAERCIATAAFSNVGRVFADSPLPRRDEQLQPGNLTLVAVESAPPIRPQTWVSFTTLSYRGELAVIANYDRLVMHESTAREILDTVVHELRNTAALPNEK